MISIIKTNKTCKTIHTMNFIIYQSKNPPPHKGGVKQIVFTYDEKDLYVTIKRYY